MDHIHVNIYICVYGGKGLINLSKFKHCDITQCINICNANSSEDDIPLNLLNLNQVDNYIKIYKKKKFFSRSKFKLQTEETLIK